MSALSETITQSAQRLAPLFGADFNAELARLVHGLFGPPIRATRGPLYDSVGAKTGPFGLVIMGGLVPPGTPMPDEIRSDVAGCVLSTLDVVDLESFRAAYAHIVAAKCLKKAAIPHIEGVLQTGITLGVICAKESALPLEDLAEELHRLNEKTPSDCWPDMVAVLAHGIVNYAVQFPTQKLGGDYLPPAAGALKNYIPPVYVVTVLKPTGNHTLHVMMAYIAVHMSLFVPGAQIPNTKEMQDGSTRSAITMSGYQYDLNGQLKPVPREQYNDRYLPQRPLIIHDERGKPMASIKFLPWQDGGVVMLIGKKLPLEGMLIFAGPQAMRGGIIPFNGREIQLSHVIPMTAASFTAFLQNFERRSNMTIRVDTSKIIKQKIADEGATSPFMARIFIGPLALCDSVFSDSTKREEFALLYTNLVDDLMSLRTTKEVLIALFTDHVNNVANGKIARIANNSIEIDVCISRELKKLCQDFLNASARTIKDGVQNLAKNFFQINIGCLFQKQASFERGIELLRHIDPDLAGYLEQTRHAWSEKLVDEIRNEMEHNGWRLADVSYKDDNGTVKVIEPDVFGQPVTQFVTLMLDRIVCFFEEIVICCIQRKLPAGISVSQIPIAQRDKELPLRFRYSLVGAGGVIWSIQYHHSTFEAS